MATTPAQFFEKNMKWIALALLFLLTFKSVQSCNRSMRLNITSGDYIHQIDSLENRYNVYYKETQDSIKDLNFLLELANEKTGAANERAAAVQSAVEKIKSNTTITVKGAEEVKDTNNKNK
jgi:hypothetical protein